MVSVSGKYAISGIKFFTVIDSKLISSFIIALQLAATPVAESVQGSTLQYTADGNVSCLDFTNS